MQIGQVIRKYRKAQNMTQEEMAKCLGVSTPAVNKWENGNSNPDITLLRPIARLLGVSLDTLLNFENDLSSKEIDTIIANFEKMFYRNIPDEAIKWIKEKIEQYPNCYELMYRAASMTFVQLLMQNMVEKKDYDEFMLECCKRAIEGTNGKEREQVAYQMMGVYLLRNNYEEAEKSLQYYSDDNPQKHIELGRLYGASERDEEAYVEYEEILSAMYSYIDRALAGLISLYSKEKNQEYTRSLAKKRHALAELFEMGMYHQMVTDYEYLEIDPEFCEALGYEKGIEEMEKSMKSKVGEMMDMKKSFLYRHLEFETVPKEDIEKIRNLM